MISDDQRRPIAVTMGDPAGVGPEVTARAWAARREHDLSPFVAIGDAAAIAAVWDGPVARVGAIDEVARLFDDALPVWHLEDSGPLTPGIPTPAGATYTYSVEAYDAAGNVSAPSGNAVVTLGGGGGGRKK